MITLLIKCSIQSIQFKTKNSENTKDKKTSFPKEYVENADLYKPV